MNKLVGLKNIAIIQARTGSNRLPGKILLQVLGKTLLELTVERISRAKMIDSLVIATTIEEQDDCIVEIAKKMKVDYFRGSEKNVLDRYYHAAKAFDASHIVRITSDCPLIDHEIIDYAINCYASSHLDFCSNNIKRTFPRGLDVEVFSFSALEDAWKNAVLPFDREHVTPYIKQHPEKFKIFNFTNDADLSHHRWTVDYWEDYILIKRIFEGLYPYNNDFTFKDILRFLQENPSLNEINRHLA